MASHQTHRESSPSQVCIPAIVNARGDCERASRPSAELGSARRQAVEPLRSHQRRTRTAQRIAAVITRWRERETLAQLGALTLRDLGLSDADVWRETRKAPWQP